MAPEYWPNPDRADERRELPKHFLARQPNFFSTFLPAIRRINRFTSRLHVLAMVIFGVLTEEKF
jgi:hypothetical protein